MSRERTDEEVKRLAPKQEILRELYIKSGNECAYPGCHNVLVDENGKFVGEVCHIEAAMPGGERFNPNMTNEDRRSFGNLMLMCHHHHVVTDDVCIYTVEKLKEMKRNHEMKYSGIIGQMMNSITDYGMSLEYTPCFNCKKISRILDWGLTDEENRENAAVLDKHLQKLLDLPIETRQLLGIMVMRSYWNRYDCIVPIHEVERATGLKPENIIQNVEILERRGIISEIEVEEEKGIPSCILYPDFESSFPYWNAIREFVKKTGTPIERICCDLDFSVFDE
ncbi:hypothetical protein [Blautia difficilis]|uniref:HNH endonuclease n=1 Tax=Blautia difficilis TaxID=2763027 RepID=A0ABR7ILT0_9FIRM|nr:hypothetical protein [Blautia difficilis]MBC5780968.1 hypothetical protein [Blautia difficilis]